MKSTIREIDKTMKGIVDTLELTGKKAEVITKAVRETGEVSRQVDGMYGRVKDIRAIAGGDGDGVPMMGPAGSARPYPEMSRAGALAGGVGEGLHTGILGGMGFAYRYPGLSMIAQAAGDVRRDVVGGVKTMAAMRAAGQSILGSAEGLGALGSTVGSGIGAAALAGYGVYEGAQYLGEMGTRYGAMTGERPGFTTGLQYEMKGRLMAMSPFISGQQAREVVEATLTAGYNEGEANTVMDYLADNIRNGMTDIGASLELYQLGVQRARVGTGELTNQITLLQTAARETSAGVGQLQESFGANLQALAAVGMSGPGTAALAGFNAQIGAYSGLGQEFAGYGGPNMGDPMFQFQMARSLGVPIWQLPGALSENPQGVPGQQYAAQVSMIRRIFPNFDQMTVDEILNSRQMMIAPQLLASVVNDPNILGNPQLLAEWIAGMRPGGPLTPGNVAGEMWKQFHPRQARAEGMALKGAFERGAPGTQERLQGMGAIRSYFEERGLGGISEGNRLADPNWNPSDIGFGIWSNPDEEMNMRLGNYYARQLEQTGMSNPFLEQILASGTAAQYLTRTKTGKLISLEEYMMDPSTDKSFEGMRDLPLYDATKMMGEHEGDIRKTLASIRSGYSAAEKRGGLAGFRRDVIGQLQETSVADIMGVSPDVLGAGSAGAAGRSMMVGLTPEARRILMPVMEGQYRGGQSNRGGPQGTG